MIQTLADAVNIVEFLIQKQGKSLEDAISEAEVPMHIREQLKKYFDPPLEILPAEMIVEREHALRMCEPDKGSAQQYFGALRRFLIEERRRSKSVVDGLSDVSSDLVRQLPIPDTVDSFQVRGLVVGHVQSGKTAAMAALIARAADQGYKLFIVLGGLWKDLRSQTQKRLDQEVTGDSEDAHDGPFVLHDDALPRWARLTASGLEGDFRPGPNDLNPNTPKLAVIKKNKRIDSLVEFLERTPFDLKELPALVIDDEADQGSIDTNYGREDDDGEPIDPAATNRRIRSLLRSLPKCAYVGFTATPYANVLIDASNDDDLYPRNFIATLPEPIGYFGARQLFGLGMSPSDLSGAPRQRPPLDIIRPVGDTDLEEIKTIADTGRGSSKLLSDAVLSFVLSSCARMSRGQAGEHFSMLVHTSQYTSPHQLLAGVVSEELQAIRQAASKPKSFPDMMRRAKEMWESDFLRVTKGLADEKLPAASFETVWKFAKQLTESVEVKVINSGSEHELDYKGHPKRYIVVGGNRLSRGLTLEGLSISFFTRKANQYDTLLQMGRWFGYRTNYHDLTRIYVPPLLSNQFADLARIEEELRNDLSKYAESENPPTPLQLKPLIRAHPAMAVTARMKMGAGQPIRLSFQNTRQQTVSFPVENKDLLKKNMESAGAFVKNLPPDRTSLSDEGMHVWTDVPASHVLDFLRSYEFSREAREVNRTHLVSYIERQNSTGELISWDVVLPRGNPALDPHLWAQGVLTRKVTRVPMTPSSIKVLSSPSDFTAWTQATGHDLIAGTTRGCLMLYLIDKDSDSEGPFKFFPNRNEAEDIVGIVIAFPASSSSQTVEYVSQP